MGLWRCTRPGNPPPHPPKPTPTAHPPHTPSHTPPPTCSWQITEAGTLINGYIKRDSGFPGRLDAALRAVAEAVSTTHSTSVPQVGSLDGLGRRLNEVGGILGGSSLALRLVFERWVGVSPAVSLNPMCLAAGGGTVAVGTGYCTGCSGSGCGGDAASAAGSGATAAGARGAAGLHCDSGSGAWCGPPQAQQEARTV